jgi:hypothetical protein
VWHVTAALLIGGLLGILVAAGPRVVGGAGVDERVASLEASAGDYLQAIADGDAARATELSPHGGNQPVVSQTMLASALRIEPVEVGPARVDGSRGSVEVRYRVGGTEVQRVLRASLTAAGWRLATSLAESPDTRSNEPAAVLRVGGVELPEHTELQLYPAVYRLDVVEGPLFAWGGDAFTIDGDPSTTTSVVAAQAIMPAFQERLAVIVLEAVAACRERPDCPIRTAFPFELADDVRVLQTLDDGRTVDLDVPIVARDPYGGVWRHVVVRVSLDHRGLPVGWLCSTPSGAAFVPCRQ